jgi:hypothetical protein
MMERNTHAKAQRRKGSCYIPIRENVAALSVLKRDTISSGGEHCSRKEEGVWISHQKSAVVREDSLKHKEKYDCWGVIDGASQPDKSHDHSGGDPGERERCGEECKDEKVHHTTGHESIIGLVHHESTHPPDWTHFIRNNRFPWFYSDSHGTPPSYRIVVS